MLIPLWFIVVQILVTIIRVATQDNFVLPPPEHEEKFVPVCTSYQSLCGLNYRYVTESGEPIELLPEGSKICTCANNVTCNTSWENTANAVVQRLLSGNGLQLEAKISFCELPEKQIPCKMGDPVIVTKGQGQFSFELTTPLMCHCHRPLVAQASWQDGAYDFIQYGCGQPRCAKKNTRVCAEIVYNDVQNFSYKYFCRCRRNEICMGELPTPEVPVTEHACHKQHDVTSVK